jgi:hypothetical protein
VVSIARTDSPGDEVRVIVARQQAAPSLTAWRTFRQH